MDFKEPDLEELIQNDLRSEINKILSQSEVEDLESTVNKTREDLESRQSPFESGSSRDLNYKSSITIKKEVLPADEERMVQTGFNMINSSSLQDLSQQNQMPRGHQEISGHFTVESYANFEGEVGRYPVAVGEHNDLQSLTWLTTVDVHALQKLTEHGTVITPAQMEQANQILQENTPGSQEPISEPRSVIQMTPTTNVQINPNENSNGNQQLDQSQNAHQYPPSTQYMPMQPHLSPDGRHFLAQQRYQLQSRHGGGPMGRNSYGEQHGARRYLPLGHQHPYPPPPYNLNRGGYVPGPSFMHQRFHHQGQPKVFPKPVYSYSCLIAMALYNSKTGCLPVSEIYNFMMENYPYFKTAPDGWKNSVRHNLSLNKCFEKVEKPNGSQRKGCLWALNPAKIAKMKEEVQKWKRKDPESIRRSMSNPEELDRELEEMRRADEEAATRRMLSLSSHGLTAQSIHHQHPSHQHRPPNLLQMHSHPPHMSPPASGPHSSHQANLHHCPDLHFSTELAQQNFALTLARSASQPPPGRANQYDHHFQSHHGHGGHYSNSNNNATTNSQDLSDMIVLTPGREKSSFFASPPNSISSSSSTASMLGTFTDCTAGFGADEDLDASLADLAGLHQEAFWDAPHDSNQSQSCDTSSHTEGEGKSVILSADISEDMPMTSSDGHIRLPPVIRMLSTSQSEQPSPDTPDYKSSSGQRVDNFGRDMSHFSNNNIKPVVMMQ